MSRIEFDLNEFENKAFQAALMRANENRVYKQAFYKSNGFDIEVKPFSAVRFAKAMFWDSVTNFIESESIQWGKEQADQDE